MDETLFKTIVVTVFLAPVPALAYWGWRYGSSRDSSLVGFILRTLTVATLGSWTLGAGGVGHGAGVAPAPALLCGYYWLDGQLNCLPPAWLTPLVSVAAFCGFAMLAEARLERDAPERHW